MKPQKGFARIMWCMKQTYLSEQHRNYSEACQQEVQEMKKHPLSQEEKEQQMGRNMRLKYASK